MALIGNFGKQIKFSVSDKKILTFEDFTETISARWAKHNVQNKLPRSEFLGSDLLNFTIKVTLDASFGVKPRKMRNKIKDCVRKGKVAHFVVGGHMVSKNKFKITQAQNEHKEILRDGKIARIIMNLTFEEYV